MHPSHTSCADPRDELRLGLDLWQALWAKPPRPLKRARGEHVLVVPGFGTNDTAMALMHRRLQAQGFITHRWNLGVNLGPTAHVLRELAKRVRAVAKESGRPVHLVGWSMGGSLARAVARRVRPWVGRVVTLGSPLSGDPACSWLSALVARCSRTPMRHRRLQRLLAQSADVPVASIFSRNDGVVHWQASASAAGSVEPIEVQASHIGMVVNPDVVDAVARALVRRPASATKHGAP